MPNRSFLAGFYCMMTIGLALVLVVPSCSQTPRKCLPISTGDGGWEAVCNLPHGSGVCGLFFVDGKTGWAVGGEGTILKTTNGGVTWSSQVSGVKNTCLFSVWFTDANNGCIVGYGSDMNGVILRTADSGATWQAQKAPKGLGLRSVCFAGSKTGWALGHREPVNDPKGSNDCGLLKTTDGGLTWSLIADVPMRWWEQGCSMCFVDADCGWINSQYNGVFKTIDGGKTWLKPGKESVHNARSICFVDGNSGWACGSDKRGCCVFRTTDGGSTWNKQDNGMPKDPPDQPINALRSVFFLDAENGWACGGVGVIVRTNDGGETWSKCRTDSTGTAPYNSLAAIRFVDRQNGWAAGDDGNIMRTVDGGETWTSVQPRIMSSVNAAFVDSRTGWITGQEGAILKTTDGGFTWVQQRPSGENNRRCGPLLLNQNSLNHLLFINQNDGWAVGPRGVMLATEDGGKNWLPRSSWLRDLPDSLLTVAFRAQRVDSDCGWILAIHEPEPNTNWTYAIRRTTDGGRTWEAHTTGTNTPIWDAWFADRNTGWEVGPKGTLMKTTDGGKTWKRKFTGVAKCHAAVQFVGLKVGWIVGQDGIIMKSRDGGETWTRQESGTSEGLIDVRFDDANTGWAFPASGGSVLTTKDGGETWTKQDKGRGVRGDPHFVNSDFGWVGGASLLRTTTGGLPGCVWAKKQPDGKHAEFGHLVVTRVLPDGLYAVHPDSKIGMKLRARDAQAKVGDYIYVHGKIASEGPEKVIDADSVDVITEGWGIVCP